MTQLDSIIRDHDVITGKNDLEYLDSFGEVPVFIGATDKATGIKVKIA